MKHALASPNHFNGRYKLESEIGRGGMGIVYCATDRLTREIVTLKRVTALRNAGEQPAVDPDELRLALTHEFQTLVSLCYTHIISVLDYGFDGEQQPFFTMTYLLEAQSILEAPKTGLLRKRSSSFNNFYKLLTTFIDMEYCIRI
ncbi:MAG: hypothetical protein AAGD96_36675 [Chloroflexota bacterium]